MASVVYYCKHCKAFMGSIEGEHASPETLGFTSLTPAEQAAMIDYDASNQTTYVKTVCEYCESALSHNPDLWLVGTPLQ